jgi:hypothetical protein
MRKAILFLGVAAVSIAAAGAAISAARIQPGLWRISTTLDMGQAMPQLTPQEIAQMRAMGVQLPAPGQPMISEVCVTAAQAALDTPPNLERTQSGCAAQNVKNAGNKVSSDIVCTGRIQGKGVMETTYSGMTHYQGTYNFNGTAEGRPQSVKSAFSANFVSANCGSVKPLQ